MPALAWWTLSNARLAIEAIATVAFAASGLIEAARRKLDAMGVARGSSPRGARVIASHRIDGHARFTAAQALPGCSGPPATGSPGLDEPNAPGQPASTGVRRSRSMPALRSLAPCPVRVRCPGSVWRARRASQRSIRLGRGPLTERHAPCGLMGRRFAGGCSVRSTPVAPGTGFVRAAVRARRLGRWYRDA